MIRRINDFSNLSNESFEKIAKVVNDRNKKKLYKICNNENEVKVALQEIKINGYKSAVEKLGEKFHVYSIFPDCIEAEQAVQSGQFKRLAWGRYSFQKVNSIGDFEHYNFDDGSIWKTIIGDDGKEYLVKEVDDSDEDKIIRQASMKKQAGIIVTDININDIIKIVYDNIDLTNQFISDLLNDSSIKQSIYNFIENKLNNIILEKLQSQSIFDQTKVNDIINLINDKITNKQITSKMDLEQFISDYVQLQFTTI